MRKLSQGREMLAMCFSTWEVSARNENPKRHSDKWLLAVESCLVQLEKLIVSIAAAWSAAPAHTIISNREGTCVGESVRGSLGYPHAEARRGGGHVSGGGGVGRGLETAVTAFRATATQRKEQVAWKRWQAAAQEGLRAAWREWTDYAIAFADLLQFPCAPAPGAPASYASTAATLAAAGALDGSAAIQRMREIIKPLSNDFQVFVHICYSH